MAAWQRNIFCAAALAALPSLGAEPITDARSELDSVQSQLSAEKNRLRETEASASAAETKLKKLETLIGQTAAGLRRLERDQQRTQADLTELSRENSRLERRQAKQKSLLTNEITTQFMRRRNDTLRIWLGDTDPSAVGNLLAYHRYVAAARRQYLEETKAALDTIATTRKQIDDKQQQLAELETRRRRELQKLELNRGERIQVIASLSEAAAHSRRTIGKLENDQQRLSALLAELQQSAARKTERAADIAAPIIFPRSQPFVKRKGHLPWPVSGKIISGFSSRADSSSMAFRGVLIDAELGTEVRAIAPGRVVFADWLRGFGLLMILDHGDGYFSLYGHNEALLREVGDHVDEWQEIATVGASGGLTNSGLYFEIRHKGKPINPVIWCSNRG